MSKAFTQEESERESLVVPPRAPLPSGTPNYVTPRGLSALQAELARWEDERSRLTDHDEVDRTHTLAVIQARIRELEGRIASATVIDHHSHPSDEVRFGAQVRVRSEDGTERAYEIVGVDEADVAHGRIAFIAPLARALLGKRPGEVVTLRSPRGEEELEIVHISYGASDAPT